MNNLTITSYELLRKCLAIVPKSQVHEFCRICGYHNISPAIHQQ